MKQIKIFTLCLLLFSCSSNQGESARNYKVDAESKSTIAMSEFIEEISYISLETTPKSFLSNIKAVFLDDDYIIVTSGATIFFFDSEGKYSHKIDKKGRGNGEYLSMSDVVVDSKNDKVMVYDLSSKRLLSYSYDGKFLEAIDNFSSSRYLRDIALLPNGNFLCSEYVHGGGEFEPTAELWEVDPSGEIISDIIFSEFKHPTQSPSFTLSHHSDGSILYSNVESDTDYLYHNGKTEILAKYDLQGRPVAATYAGMDNMSFSNDYWMKGKFLNSRTYTVHKNNFIFARWHGQSEGQTYYTLINTKKKTIQSGNNIDCQLSNNQVIYPSAVSEKGVYYVAIENNIDGVISMVMDPNSIDDPEILSRFGLNDTSLMNANPMIQLLHVKK